MDNYDSAEKTPMCVPKVWGFNFGYLLAVQWVVLISILILVILFATKTISVEAEMA